MREPFRRQGEMRFEIPEDSLPDDHRARLLWQVVETTGLDFYGKWSRRWICWRSLREQRRSRVAQDGH